MQSVTPYHIDNTHYFYALLYPPAPSPPAKTDHEYTLSPKSPSAKTMLYRTNLLLRGHSFRTTSIEVKKLDETKCSRLDSSWARQKTDDTWCDLLCLFALMCMVQYK
ncbi:unnamed protein product [Ectocarpus fasciculatus]